MLSEFSAASAPPGCMIFGVSDGVGVSELYKPYRAAPGAVPFFP
jgi:hypothetical protein